MQCPICVETISATQRFECRRCEYVTCKKCVVNYITSQLNDPCCMNCGQELCRHQLASQLPKAKLDGPLKRHRERVLIEREKLLMPDTQVYVNQELQRRANAELLRSLCDAREELKKKLRDIETSIRAIQRNLIPPLEERQTFVHRCPFRDCRGFLSSVWKCSLCNNYTCSECGGVKGPERHAAHTCKPEDMEAMNLIKQDCKKCPGCACFIQRISGCDLMWCVACHVSFSWRTGKLLKNVAHNHNPHYYEFQREHGTLRRELNDVPCGGMPSVAELQRRLSNHKDVATFILSLHRVVLHLEHVEHRNYRPVPADNVDLRVKYMLNELTEEKFKQQVQMREKAANKRTEMDDLFTMFHTTMSDMFRQLCVCNTTDVLQWTTFMMKLCEYFNEAALRTAQCYNCTSFHIETTPPRFVLLKVTAKGRHALA